MYFETFQHHAWAGAAFDGGGRFAVISWRAGRAHPRVLDKFSFRGSFGLGRRGAINAVGVTRRGAVVAAVDAQVDGGRSRGYAWTRAGHRYTLAGPRAAFAIVPMAVTRNDHILGYAATGRRHRPSYTVLRWNTIRSRPHVLFRIRAGATAPIAEQRGDVVWIDRRAHTRAHLFDGQQYRLLDDRGWDTVPWVAQGHYVWTDVGVQKWNLARLPTSGPIVSQQVIPARPGVTTVPQAASLRGDVTYGGDLRHVRFANGTVRRLPREYTANGPEEETFTPAGTLAYTGRDRLIHLFRCRF
ncbi:MAG TPA: hypothetical protein VE441_08605 [Mycobacterium sp.]|nr:hypothetical protein [Mycobacterium sp.]